MGLLDRDKRIYYYGLILCLVLFVLPAFSTIFRFAAIVTALLIAINIRFLKIPIFPYDRILSAVSENGIIWKKEKGIRIYERGTFSHAGCVYNPFVLRVEHGFRMYFRGGDNFSSWIYTAESLNAVTWGKESRVIFERLNHNIKEIDSCSIIRSGDRLRMFFCGYDGRNWKIYSAVKRNAVNWEVEEGIRISNDSGFDSTFARDPSVVKTSHGFILYYLGSDGNRHRILRAHSRDGLSWNNKGVCIDVETGEHPRCLRMPMVYPADKSTFRMYFTGGSEHPLYHSCILSAISEDGVYWTREEGVRIKYDRRQKLMEVLSPYVIKNADHYRMYFAGIGAHILYPFTKIKYGMEMGRNFPGEHNQDFRVISKDLTQLTKKKICLDLGCGSGLYTKELAKSAIKTIAVDSNLEDLFRVKESKLKNTYIVNCDIANLPFKDRAFNFALSIEVLTHLNTDNMNKSLLELKRVMRKNSEIIVTLHNRLRFILHSIKHMSLPSVPYKTSGLDIWPLSAKKFIDDLYRLGFMEVKEKKYLNFFNGFSWQTYKSKVIKSWTIIRIEDLLSNLPIVNKSAITFMLRIINK